MIFLLNAQRKKVLIVVRFIERSVQGRDLRAKYNMFVSTDNLLLSKYPLGLNVGAEMVLMVIQLTIGYGSSAWQAHVHTVHQLILLMDLGVAIGDIPIVAYFHWVGLDLI